jgi:hypothetical protein
MEITAAGNAADQPSAADIEKEARRQIDSGATLPLDVIFASMNICAGSPIPAGWIKVDDSWNPTACGNPTSIVYNVWTITQYSTMPVGSTLLVCANAPTPHGWVEINRSWNPDRCGHPSAIINNLKLIKRVS